MVSPVPPNFTQFRLISSNSIRFHPIPSDSIRFHLSYPGAPRCPPTSSCNLPSPCGAAPGARKVPMGWGGIHHGPMLAPPVPDGSLPSESCPLGHVGTSEKKASAMKSPPQRGGTPKAMPGGGTGFGHPVCHHPSTNGPRHPLGQRCQSSSRTPPNPTPHPFLPPPWGCIRSWRRRGAPNPGGAGATPARGLYNQRSGPWGRAGGRRRRFGEDGVGGGQGWVLPPGVPTAWQPILRMECRATVQQPRSSELML